ncbi:MAG: (Fe-S)-binding protein [Elusimicrobiota bacterium]
MHREREAVADPGIDERVKSLRPEEIEEAIGKVLDPKASARFRAYLDSCVHCALCANACHFFNSHDKDPKYSPVAKVKQTIWEIVRRKGKVGPDFMKLAARIAYTECNGCRRCSMYCPFGIDIAFFMMAIRRICHILGLVPQYLQDTVNSHSTTMNQMWVQQDEWVDTLQWQEDEAGLEYAGARIPLDVEGADFMYSVIAPEPKILAQLLANMAIIAKAAGLNWTMPGTDGWDNSNMAMYSGDFESMARVERLHWETALRLKVKKVVMGECGHAYRGAVYDGPKWLSWKNPPLPMMHAVEFYYDLLKSGRIKIAKKYDKPVTVQDPCNVVRGRGLGHKLRYVMRELCSDFRDMTPNHEHNYCCAAGGGVINCGSPWKRDRVRGNRVKAEQIKATGAEVVVTPCHNCHSGIEDIIGYYKLGSHVKFVSEILVECMERPEGPAEVKPLLQR